MSNQPSMARIAELLDLYRHQMPPPQAKKQALADAQYEADERDAIQNEQ